MIGATKFLRPVCEEIVLFFCSVLLIALSTTLARPQRSITTNLDSAASGLYEQESFTDRGGTFHWTNGNARITIPNPGGPINLQLSAAGGPNRVARADIASGATTLTFSISPQLRQYHLLLKPNSASQLNIQIASNVFREDRTNRSLGIAISGIRAQGDSIAEQTQILLASMFAVSWAVGRLFRHQIWTIAVITLISGIGATLTALLAWADPNVQVGIALWAAGSVMAFAAPTTWQQVQNLDWRVLIAHPVVVALVVVGGGALLASRMFDLVNRYAVNVLFSDEWDFFTPLFNGQGALAMFVYQHGPHRQGLGGLALTLIANLTDWNSRIVAFAIGAIIVAAALAALVLKRLLFERWTVADIAIPLIYFSTAQYEALTVVPNPAHGAIPALLVVLVPIAWMIKRITWRYAALSLLHFFMVFTGFGIFMGLIIPVLVGIECLCAIRRQEKLWFAPALALVSMAAAWVLFAINYQIKTATDCQVFPHPRPWEYPVFMGFMFSRFVGFDAKLAFTFAGVTGGIILVICLVSATKAIWQTIGDNMSFSPANRAIIVLTVFSLIYSANTAFGRVCGGIDGGQASRYIPLLTPAFLGMYFTILLIRPAWPRYAVSALLIVLLLPVPLPVRSDDAAAARGFAKLKRTWSTCYLAEHSTERCNERVSMPIYPANVIGQRLAYLQAHHLNFFAETDR